MFAAVIPKWIGQLMKSETVHFNGDGKTSRNFCFVANAVQANLLAETTELEAAVREVYNVAVGDRTSLNELYELLRSRPPSSVTHLIDATPIRNGFCDGALRHSLADIGKSRQLLGFDPSRRVGDGLRVATDRYIGNSPTSTSPTPAH